MIGVHSNILHLGPWRSSRSSPLLQRALPRVTAPDTTSSRAFLRYRDSITTRLQLKRLGNSKHRKHLITNMPCEWLIVPSTYHALYSNICESKKHFRVSIASVYSYILTRLWMERIANISSLVLSFALVAASKIARGKHNVFPHFTGRTDLPCATRDKKKILGDDWRPILWTIHSHCMLKWGGGEALRRIASKNAIVLPKIHLPAGTTVRSTF